MSYLWILTGFCICLVFSALEALINFAYSGRILINNGNVQNLMMGAAFLQLTAVREACAKHLVKE